MAKKKREAGKVQKQAGPAVEASGRGDAVSMAREKMLLGFLVLYVFLLGLGTFGELFEVEWILSLPLFR